MQPPPHSWCLLPCLESLWSPRGLAGGGIESRVAPDIPTPSLPPPPQINFGPQQACIINFIGGHPRLLSHKLHKHTRQIWSHHTWVYLRFHVFQQIIRFHCIMARNLEVHSDQDKNQLYKVVWVLAGLYTTILSWSLRAPTGTLGSAYILYNSYWHCISAM